jgi:outer membrane protein
MARIAWHSCESRRELNTRHVVTLVLPVWALLGCASTYLRLAPASPDQPVIPQSGEGQHLGVPPPPSGKSTAEELADERSAVQPGRRYGLPELVELAAASNPETRILWLRAREAALAVGVAHSSYWPMLSVVAFGAYQHSSFPVSSLPAGITLAAREFLPGISVSAGQENGTSGRFGVDTFEVLPFVTLRWEALDFSRGPAVKAAEQTSVAANLLFVGEHQKLLFQVSKGFFSLGAARAQVRVAEEALERTRTIARSVEARFGRGVATTVEVAEGRREVAQAEYGLTEATAAERVALSALLTAMGVDPRTALDVETVTSRQLAGSLRQPVDSYVETALASRPDLLAASAHFAEADALIDQATSYYLPRLTLTGTGGAQVLGAKAGEGSFRSATIPTVTALASLEWLILDGGARGGGVDIARARREEANLEVQKRRNAACQEVLSAYDEANAALARYLAAVELERAAAVADDATTSSYQHGVSTLTDAAGAQRAHSLASATKERVYAEARIAVTALTFAAGELWGVAAIPEPYL